MKENSILRMTLTLVVIAVVVSLAMHYVNAITAPLIAANEQEKLNRSLATVIDADSFEIIEENEQYTIYKATKGTELKGYCVKNTTSGYGGDLTLLTGISNQLMVTGVELLSHSETAGLGANAAKDEFKAQYKDKTENIGVVKNTPSDNDIVAISGATITSKAVTDGVNNAVALVKEVKADE